MSKRKAYPIELLLKLKTINPDYPFEGEDKRVYEQFLEEQAENSLLDALDEKPKKKLKKVKQVSNHTDTESLDVVNNEINETTSKEEA